VSRKRGRIIAGTTAHVPYRLSLARQYAQVARDEFVREGPASRTVAAGNAVLAGIAAADVLCLISLGVRSASQNHSDAIALLKECDPQSAQDLAVLLRDKGQSHYGTTPLDAATLTRMMRSLERLLERADAQAGRISRR